MMTTNLLQVSGRSSAYGKLVPLVRELSCTYPIGIYGINQGFDKMQIWWKQDNQFEPPRKLVISITSDVCAFFEGSDCQSAIDIVSECHTVLSNIKEALWKSRKKGIEKKKYKPELSSLRSWIWLRHKVNRFKIQKTFSLWIQLQFFQKR